MADTPVIKAERREEFGKGAARRLRRDWRLPGVLYSKGEETVHFHASLLEMQALVRNDGVNAVLELELDGEQHLAMVRAIDQNILTLNIDHIDLLGIKRGEKVEVDVNIVTEGENVPGSVLIQEADVLTIEIDALKIPEEIVVSIEGMEIGDQILAKDVKLPEGATLITDGEDLVINVTYEEVDEELEEAAEEAEAGGAEAGAESADDESAEAGSGEE
ncbi:50S ribosomal protein L25/general stress protein Ctc [Corynebacterium cystitidis]|uniref:Large ribosomal subunit protein bL25 n=1 Tax=Corynebacterium cystitidis DSM 20524 TaxID=1121357 RepID=A0A1H9TR13_9CORY|nr:50S ribosomal protein L25/general stress protein Ctc [Corynebacterium cystitidis]WJY81993.1 50S ribosomal protein L25 [Corynebacterium cystitidis DSM 20524]SER99461.1 large subunit ribosomal protein L25 [Corynebacterium cystitidis DSM 20524]SNV81133.1 50S ribosomal protein L25/general stress protein Ctc [Corynebacterium cystitidis]